MAADPYAKLNHEYHYIASCPDFVVRVIEHGLADVETVDGSGQTTEEWVPKKVHQFKVRKSALAEGSRVLQAMFDPASHFKEAKTTTIDLLEDNPTAMKIWFKILHNSPAEYEEFDLKTIWEVLAAAHKYEFNPKSTGAQEWFSGWYAAHRLDPFDFEDYQALLFPCHSFDFPRGFAETTKYLVYNARGHITEKRPSGIHCDHLRLDHQIIQQVNAAKGRLKTILHRELYKPIEKILRATHCSKRATALLDYEVSLHETGAWPVESAFMRNSINDMLSKLGGLRGRSTDSGSVHTCRVCDFSHMQVVRDACKETRTYFDGLCLDCMDASKPKFGDADEDYWKHAENRNWDNGCRIRHLQPTWYFSFMGRRQKMIEFNSKSRRRPWVGHDSDSESE